MDFEYKGQEDIVGSADEIPQVSSGYTLRNSRIREHVAGANILRKGILRNMEGNAEPTWGRYLREQYNTDLGEEEMLGDLKDGDGASGETRNGLASFDSAEEEVDRDQ
jgi:hypothetical protein